MVPHRSWKATYPLTMRGGHHGRQPTTLRSTHSGGGRSAAPFRERPGGRPPHPAEWVQKRGGPSPPRCRPPITHSPAGAPPITLHRRGAQPPQALIALFQAVRRGLARPPTPRGKGERPSQYGGEGRPRAGTPNMAPATHARNRRGGSDPPNMAPVLMQAKIPPRWRRPRFAHARRLDPPKMAPAPAPRRRFAHARRPKTIPRWCWPRACAEGIKTEGQKI